MSTTILPPIKTNSNRSIMSSSNLVYPENATKKSNIKKNIFVSCCSIFICIKTVEDES
jgi:hypothetical protein